VGHGAPAVDKIRTFHDHPLWIRANADELAAALARVPSERRAAARVAFTAHSVPTAMAERSAYREQLLETAERVAAAAGAPDWSLVWQSRSGPPGQPWLAPDILDHLDALAGQGVADVALAPIGFISDHLEVLYDLDLEAAERAASLGLGLVRAATAGTHPDFRTLMADLVLERLDPARPRPALGRRGPAPDSCPPDCCPPPGAPLGISGPRRAGRPAAAPGRPG
jgi:ferrochelatase